MAAGEPCAALGGSEAAHGQARDAMMLATSNEMPVPANGILTQDALASATKPPTMISPTTSK